MNVQSTNGKLIVRPESITDKSGYSIVIVDDDEMVRSTLVAILTKEGYERVYTAKNAEELESILSKTDPTLILMDLDLGRGSHEGFELMERIDNEGLVATNYLVMSGNNDKETLIKAFRSRAIDFLEKPIDRDYLRFRVEKALIDIEFRGMALTDPMTKMANKGTFLGQLQYHINAFYRHNRPLSLVMMDVDKFKEYNDTFGHLEGDYVLKKAANFFPTQLRKTDLFARYGGEEFAIVMPETSFESAFATFSRVHWNFKEVCSKPEEEKHQVTFSAGISTLTKEVNNVLFPEYNIPENGSQMDCIISPEDVLHIGNTMIKTADEGLYEVKRNGRNNCYPMNCITLGDQKHR